MATKDDDADLLATAKERYARCLAAESEGRDKAKNDIRFAAASPDDPYQWSDAEKQQRATAQRPYLTINKLPQHIRQVTNDIRQNRPAIRFRPADDKSDPEVADVLMGLVRHIEANSDADIAYDTASEHQVTHGEGYIRVLHDYVREDSFDQDIFIKRVKHWERVHMDPDIEDPAGADAQFCFIEEQIGEKEFEAEYPEADPIDWKFADSDPVWFSQGEKKVRVCEYFYVDMVSDTLNLYASGVVGWASQEVPTGALKGEKPIKTRKAQRKVVRWCKMNGQQVLEKKDFPCRWIPVARVVGNEWYIEGKTIVSGIVRGAKDSQRMYNVAQSAIVERVMQAPKAPWLAPVDAITGYEQVWQTANTANHSFLPWNHLDDNGQPVPKPERVMAATVEPGLTQVAMGAADDIKSETGQYDASLGQRSNETSGRAIMARQREGDTSTYHYVDNLARAVRHIGRIILDMLPHIYDQARVARILGEDGDTQGATIDPTSPQAVAERQEMDGATTKVFNPFLGVYDVYATTGPSFTTRRVEAVEAMTQMTQANPQLWQVIGDQLVKSMDWPGAEEMAERLKAVLLPQVQQAIQSEEGQQLPPQVQAQLQQMSQQIQQMGQALQQAQAELQDKQADRDNKVQVEQIKQQGEIAKAQAEVEKTRMTLVAQQGQGVAEQAISQALQRIGVIEQVLGHLGNHLAAQQEQFEPVTQDQMIDAPLAGGIPPTDEMGNV